MIWNEHTRTMLYLLKSKGGTEDTIADTMSTLLEQEVTADDVVMLWADMHSSGWIKARELSRKRAQYQRSKNYKPQEWQADRNALIEANVMHLIDLKRAGHSPRFITPTSRPGATELRITAEGKGVRYRTADTSSYLGSAAGLCADFL